jgi:hypothetical protein
MINIPKALVAIASGALLIAANGCSTATDNGLCKPAESTGMVAATTDPNGEPWSLIVGSTNAGSSEGDAATAATYELKCTNSAEQGSLRVESVITDSLKVPKAGLVVAANLGGISGVLDLTAADKNTDSCGTARFDIDWKCPADKGEIRESTLVVSSGALSGSLKITVEHSDPATEQ